MIISHKTYIHPYPYEHYSKNGQNSGNLKTIYQNLNIENFHETNTLPIYRLYMLHVGLDVCRRVKIPLFLNIPVPQDAQCLCILKYLALIRGYFRTYCTMPYSYQSYWHCHQWQIHCPCPCQSDLKSYCYIIACQNLQ